MMFSRRIHLGVRNLCDCTDCECNRIPSIRITSSPIAKMLGMYARCYVSARFSFSISGYYVLPHWRKHHWCGDGSRILLAATSAAIFPIVGISALQWSESVLSNGRNQSSSIVGIRALRCLVQHGKRTLYLAQFLKEECIFYASMVE
jgi:hypothetical protein